jgi:hypothetical protein
MGYVLSTSIQPVLVTVSWDGLHDHGAPAECDHVRAEIRKGPVAFTDGHLRADADV